MNRNKLLIETVFVAVLLFTLLWVFPYEAQSQKIVDAYLQLFACYAQLNARGLLDAACLAAWQNAAVAYSQFLSGK